MLAAALVVAALAAGGDASGAASNAAERARAILADERYQTRLPAEPEGRISRRGFERRVGASTDDRDTRISARDGARAASASTSRDSFLLAVWLIGIGAVITVLALITWSIIERRRARGIARSSRTNARPAPVELLAPAPIDEADRLAAAGRFAEALHLLLAHAILAIERSLAFNAPRSWTSREIGRSAPLDEAPRALLGHLVFAVESSRFGGRAVTAEDWRLASERFDRLAELLDPGPSDGAR